MGIVFFVLVVEVLKVVIIVVEVLFCSTWSTVLEMSCDIISA